jgi:glutamate/tyrosine decarboxylase-like PLP-dependent enzyme
MTNPPEESLDPASWDDFRRHGHRVLDELIDWLRDVRERPAWRAVPEATRAALRAPLPTAGEGLDSTWDDFRRHVLPYPWGNVHPRFWGWVVGTGSPSGALAELATAVFNVNAWGGHQSSAWVEAQVLDWCKTMVGFPLEASGLLVSGGSVANLVALTAARDSTHEALAASGLYGHPRQLVFYASAETHNSVDKAIRLIGVGSAGLRSVPVLPDFTVDITALQRAISGDRAAGLEPCCVIGNAGTINTGAIDDLPALADLCEREDLWLHIDGAFGALAAISKTLRPLLRGMERADSLAFDLHKWLYMPYDVGCVLIRDPLVHRRSFGARATYLAPLERGAAAGPYDFSALGPELSREFRALKVWMLIKEHGVDKYARLIEQNVAQAKYLAGEVHRHDELELMAPVQLNIVCLRYLGTAGRPDATGLDKLNRELLMRIQERGIAVPSSTALNGRFAIRVAISNHRSVRGDFDVLVKAVVEIGRELSAERKTGAAFGGG